MQSTSLGEFIRELRAKTDLSLREFAKLLDISPAFMSDIELGRRFPSDETLHKISKVLKVSVEEFKKHDHRDAVTDIKRLIETNPRLGFAFRTAVDDLKEGKITSDEFERRVKGNTREKP